MLFVKRIEDEAKIRDLLLYFDLVLLVTDQLNEEVSCYYHSMRTIRIILNCILQKVVGKENGLQLTAPQLQQNGLNECNVCNNHLDAD